jgi:hypothetical protein
MGIPPVPYVNLYSKYIKWKGRFKGFKGFRRFRGLQQRLAPPVKNNGA